MQKDTVSKDCNKTCKCNDYIFMQGQEAWRSPKRDSLGLPVFICDKCKEK